MRTYVIDAILASVCVAVCTVLSQLSRYKPKSTFFFFAIVTPAQVSGPSFLLGATKLICLYRALCVCKCLYPKWQTFRILSRVNSGSNFFARLGSQQHCMCQCNSRQPEFGPGPLFTCFDLRSSFHFCKLFHAGSTQSPQICYNGALM